MFSGVFTLVTMQVVYAQETTGATLVFDPAEGSYEVGASFALAVKLNTGGVESDHTETYLKYDPTLLQVVDANEEEVGVQVMAGELYETILSNLADETEGTIEFSQLSLDPEEYYSSSEAGVLVTVNFKVLAAGEATVEVVFTGAEQDLEDSNVYNAETNEDMLVSAEAATFTLTEPAATEEVEPQAELPVLTSVLITSDGATLLADGIDEMTVTVTVLDGSGVVMVGEMVDLTSNADGTLAETVLTTNADGQASTVYRAGVTVGEFTVSAVSRSKSEVQTNLVFSQETVTNDEPAEEEVAAEEVLPVPGESVPKEPAEIENVPNGLTDVGPADVALLALLALTVSGLAYWRTRRVTAV